VAGASVWAIDVLTGTRLWSVGAGRIQARPFLHDGRLCVATIAGSVKALDPADGSEIWSVDRTMRAAPARSGVSSSLS